MVSQQAQIAAWIMTAATTVFFGGYVYLRAETGLCIRTEALDSFDVERFKGVWYELQRDSAIMFETGECVTAQYGDREKGVSVQNTEYWIDEGREAQIDGWARANNWYPGEIGVIFGGDYGADYRVIATDYDNYAIIYSCEQFGPVGAPEFAWVLHRQPLAIGSAERDAALDIVNPIFDSQLADYDREGRLQDT